MIKMSKMIIVEDTDGMVSVTRTLLYRFKLAVNTKKQHELLERWLDRDDGEYRLAETASHAFFGMPAMLPSDRVNVPVISFYEIKGGKFPQIRVWGFDKANGEFGYRYDADVLFSNMNPRRPEEMEEETK